MASASRGYSPPQSIEELISRLTGQQVAQAGAYPGMPGTATNQSVPSGRGSTPRQDVRPATGTGIGYQTWGGQAGGQNPMAAQTPASESGSGQNFLDWTNDPAGVNAPMAGGADTELRAADFARGAGWGGVDVNYGKGGARDPRAYTAADPAFAGTPYPHGAGPGVRAIGGMQPSASQIAERTGPTPWRVAGPGLATVVPPMQPRTVQTETMPPLNTGLPAVRPGTVPATAPQLAAAAAPQVAPSAPAQPLPTVTPPPAQAYAQPPMNPAQAITLGALAQVPQKAAPAVTGGATGATMLSRGMRDSEPVAALQAALNRVSNSRLDVDGDFGPVTERAVRAFQRDKGLEVDGIAGPKTMAAIDKISRLGEGDGSDPKVVHYSGLKDEDKARGMGGGFDLWGALTDAFGGRR